MADLNNAFDKEQDLSKSFDAESSQAPNPGDTASMGSLASLGRAILQGALPFEDRAVAGAKTGLQNLGLQQGSGDYDTNLAMIRARNQASANAHPTLDTVGKIAGGVGAVAMAPEAIASKIGLTGEGLMNAAKGGAALGALQGASETQDLTDTKDLVKNTAIGAGLGAGTGAIASSAAAGISAGLDRAAKTKLVGSLLQAARASRNGINASGPQASADLAKQSEDNILQNFLPRIKQIRENLQGKMDAATGQYMPGEYDALYQTANEKLPNGVDVGGLADRVKAYQDMINKSPVLKASYSPEEQQQLQGVIDALKEQVTGKPAGPIDPNMPEGMLPETAPSAPPAPMSVSELRQEMQNLQDGYDKSPQKNGMLLDLKKIYDAHLDSTLDDIGLGGIKDALDAKKSKLSAVEQMLGVKPGQTGIEPQQTARKIANMFEKAANEDPEALNDVVQAGQHLLNLDPEAAPVISSMAQDAEKNAVATNVNAGFSLNPMSQSFLKSGAANLGLGIGKVQRALDNVPAFRTIQDVIKGATNLTNTDPQQVGILANHMSESEDPIIKRMGGLLNKVVTDPDPGRRRALMFSLSQQPTFRQALGNVVKGFTPNEDEWPSTAPQIGGQ
jgi:hypothetical protein